MLGIFRKKSQRVALRTSFFPRDDRIDIEGDVYIRRVGRPTLRSRQGNISDGGLYVVIPGHDLERGKKVEIVLVGKNESISRINRLMGIVIRVDDEGAALVTYKKKDTNSVNMNELEQQLEQEFGNL